MAVTFCLLLHTPVIAEEMDSFLWVKAGKTKERELLLKYGIPSSYKKNILRYAENQHVDFTGWKDLIFSSDASGVIKKITGERTVIQDDTSKSTNLDNDLVRSAQKWLEMFGYEIGPVDGVLGPKTRKAMLHALEGTRVLNRTALEELTDKQLLNLYLTGECSGENTPVKNQSSRDTSSQKEAKPKEKTYSSQNADVRYGTLSFQITSAKFKKKYRTFEISPKDLIVSVCIWNFGKRPEPLHRFSFGVIDGSGAIYEPTSVENWGSLYSNLNPRSGAYPEFVFENFPSGSAYYNNKLFFAIVTSQGDNVAVFKLDPKTY